MSSDPGCIFCKIASGQIPALKVWDSPDALAFLDVGPLADGHTLVIPKAHYQDIRAVPSEVLGKVLGVIPQLGSAIMRATSASGLNFLQNTGRSAGQSVFHLHFHLIPRVDNDGLGYRWNAGKYGPGRAEELLAKIQREVQAS